MSVARFWISKLHDKCQMATEISLDLDMVSAICPNCHILLVEANSPSIINLGTAVNEAVTLGANEVSNSYGGSEFAGEQAVCTAYYNHPGHVFTASAGDNGYGVEQPAAYNTVTTSISKFKKGS